MPLQRLVQSALPREPRYLSVTARGSGRGEKRSRAQLRVEMHEPTGG